MPPECLGEHELVNQFLAAGNARQQVAIHGVQADVTVPHALLELALLLRGGAGPELVISPLDLKVPLEPRLGGIVLGLLDEFEGAGDVMGLLGGDVRLDVRVTDIHVRVHEDINDPRAHRLEVHVFLRQHLRADGYAYRDRLPGRHRCGEDFHRLRARAEVHLLRLLAANAHRCLDRLPNAANIESHHVGGFAVTPCQGAAARSYPSHQCTVLQRGKPGAGRRLELHGVPQHPRAREGGDGDAVLARLQRPGRHFEAHHVRTALRGLAKNRSVACASRGLVLARQVVDFDAQLRRVARVRVRKIQLQPAGLRRRGLQAEEDLERLRRAWRPAAITHARLDIRPVPLRVGLPDDIHPWLPVILVTFRPEGELGRIGVLGANGPQQGRGRGRGGGCRGHQHPKNCWMSGA